MQITVGGKSVNVDDSFASLPPDQQDATVNEIAQHIGATQGTPSPVDNGSAVDSMKAFAQGARRTLAQVPHGIAQLTALAIAPYSGINPDWAERGLEATAPGRALLEASKASPQEQALASSHPVSSTLGEIAPALLMPGGQAEAGAGMLTKAGTSGMNALLASQVMPYDTPEQRAKAGAGAFMLGTAGDAALRGANKMLAPAAKYLPGVNKNALAAKELNIARSGKSAADERAIYNRIVDMFGPEDASKLSLYDITGDPEVKNKALAYAASQNMQGSEMIKAAAAAKAKAIEDRLTSYGDTMRLSNRESNYLQALQNDVLPNSKVSADAFNQITSDPVIRNFLKANAKTTGAQLPESAMLFQAETAGMHPASASYLDAVRKRLQEKRFAPDTAPSDARHYKAAVQKIDAALSDATGGRYDAMKGLQQRQLLTNQLDQDFANVGKTLKEGQSTIDLQDLQKIFRGKNFQDLAQEANSLKSPQRRAVATRSLQLIQHFVKDADPRSVVKALGKGDQPGLEGGGTTALVVKPVAKFLRGEYNKSMAYLIDHPDEYIKQLEAIDKTNSRASYVPELAKLLGGIEAGNQVAEEPQ